MLLPFTTSICVLLITRTLVCLHVGARTRLYLCVCIGGRRYHLLRAAVLADFESWASPDDIAAMVHAWAIGAEADGGRPCNGALLQLETERGATTAHLVEMPTK